MKRFCSNHQIQLPDAAPSAIPDGRSSAKKSITTADTEENKTNQNNTSILRIDRGKEGAENSLQSPQKDLSDGLENFSKILKKEFPALLSRSNSPSQNDRKDQNGALGLARYARLTESDQKAKKTKNSIFGEIPLSVDSKDRIDDSGVFSGLDPLAPTFYKESRLRNSTLSKSIQIAEIIKNREIQAKSKPNRSTMPKNATKGCDNPLRTHQNIDFENCEESLLGKDRAFQRSIHGTESTKEEVEEFITERIPELIDQFFWKTPGRTHLSNFEVNSYLDELAMEFRKVIGKGRNGEYLKHGVSADY